MFLRSINGSFGIDRDRLVAAAAAFASCGAIALAQPQIVSLGSSAPNSVTSPNGGTISIGGSPLHWTMTGTTIAPSSLVITGGGYVSADGQYAAVNVLNTAPQLSGNTASGVTPPFSETPTLVSTPIAATESRAARWNASTNTYQDLGPLPIVPSLMVYGSGSSGGSSGNFLAPHAISATGRFIVGQGYVSSYNSAAGNTISNNTFHWRPWIWDADANAGAGGYTILPTPFRTSTNTWRRRTGNAYAVSADGTVVVGAQEHNVSTGPAADPDGGRLVVWRKNGGTGEYEMTYLPNGVDGSGFPYTFSSTPRSVHMNAAGTIIVGIAIDNSGSTYLGKWLWNAGTSSWDPAINLGTGLGEEASWLPGSVTSCGVPAQISPTGMSDDGNTIVGTARYSTCGSFMSGGFIWTSSTNSIVDWYDHLLAAGTPGLFDNYGPIGDNGDPLRGLPRLGFPSSISADGNNIVGFQGGTQLIPGAVPWVLYQTGGPGCVPAVITSSPAATVNFSACSSSVILNVSAAGTLPLTYQWYKDSNALVDGVSGGGSTIEGATTRTLRINPPLSSFDVGIYDAEVTAGCGVTATSAAATVQLDPAFPPVPNDVCSAAQTVALGTNVLSPAQSPCGAFIEDPASGASCVSGSKTDRWFVFTPISSGTYRLETCGSNYDTVMSVFTACGGSELACNDNHDIGPSTGCSSNRSRIGSLAMTAGTPYYIRIAAPQAAFLSATSTMNLSILVAPPPAANDSCSTPSVAVLGANNFDTTEATSDFVTLSCHATSFTVRDVWFAYTAPAAGRLRAATCPGTTLNTVLSFHDGACGAEVACNDNAGISGCTNQSVIENYQLAGGQTVHIRVAGNSATAFGTGVLTLTYDCDADLDNNGAVDLSDLALLLANFGCQSSCPVDLNNDGQTTLEDLSLLLSSFGQLCQ